MARRGQDRSAYLLSGAAVVALSAFASVAHAEAKVRYEIPRQPLGNALVQFGAQSGHPILAGPELTASKTTPGISIAESNPDAALRSLLAGTGLSYRRDGDVFVIVQAERAPRAVTLTPTMKAIAAETVSGSAVEGLVVTAQKRRENIQDVPIAISAFTQDKLEISQIAGGPDLMTQVPNMTFTKTNFSGYSIQIRGIGTQAISATTDPAVSVSHNNTAFIRNRFFEQEFYDLERVEVLRGPQGTLYGRNATAGVVNLITAKPSFDYETKASVDLGNYNSRRFEGMLNMPLAEDKAALRFAGAWTKRDGYSTNQITGNPIDGRDLWSTRLSLRVSPNDAIDANLILEHFEENDDRLRSGKQLCHKDLKTEIAGVPMPTDESPQWIGLGSAAGTFSQGCAPASMYADESFETPNGFSLPYYQPLGILGLPVVVGLDPYLSTTQSRDLRVIESTVDPHYRAQSDLGELQINADLGASLTLTSETAYSADFVFSTQDYNRFNTAPGAFDTETTALIQREGVFDRETGVFCDPQIGCADRVVAVDLSTARSRQFSEELRLASNFDGPFNFSLGANFLRYDTEDKYYVFINTLSFISAMTQWQQPPRSKLPYVPGVTDNSDCLLPGRIPGDPGAVQDFTPCIYMDPNPIDSLNDQGHNYFLSKNPYKLISYAGFGEAYWNITDDLKLTAGLRLTVDKKTAPLIPSWLLVADYYGYPVQEVIKQEWREPTGRLTIDWKPDLAFTDDTLFYASYAHGYKAGGINPPPTTVIYASTVDDEDLVDSVTHPKTFDPEFVDAFEIGTKNTLFDGRLTMNLNGFYYDYEGYQISQIVDRSAVNMNFDATVWGLEFESDWQALENLRFGLKVGYENTRVADGEQAIDLMDRTAGHDDWVVARPFPTIPSSCILPVWLVTYGGVVHGRATLNEIGGPGWCADFYIAHIDSVTQLSYVPNPTETAGANGVGPGSEWYGYPGFDPLTAPNNGEGFFKDLSGNELPNAPHYTTTVTADWTLPLGADWTATLHTDIYYQSEAWTRIFNMDGYDKLKAYYNVNFAAIFQNEESGWNIMAYVKNVLDRDSITGAFLNSDDTGLTTNVFLTEPRLYGVRISKNWSGAPFWKGEDAEPHKPGTPYPLTLELGGSVQRHDASYETFAPDFLDAFAPTLDPLSAQNGDLDWGDGREIKLIYKTAVGGWSASFDARFGRTNGAASHIAREQTAKGCSFKYSVCQYFGAYLEPFDYVGTEVGQREEHTLIDFMVGKDVGLGAVMGMKSQLGLGVRYAQLKSQTDISIYGIPHWTVPHENAKYLNTQHHRYDAEVQADRSFEGEGPVLSWSAAKRLIGDEAQGHADLEWMAAGGVLFGRQKAAFRGHIEDAYYDELYERYRHPYDRPATLTSTPLPASRARTVTVPTLDLSVGLSYSIDRLKLSSGYRWERYFDVIDGGMETQKDYDRTIDGPYFKVAVGFGN